MRPWMKAGLFVVLVLGLSWGGAIWYWRATNRMPANGDLAIYLVALPLCILAAAWIGRSVMTRLAAAPAPAAASGAAAAPAQPSAAQTTVLALHAVALRTAHGGSADDLSTKLAEGKARAELDPELVDDQGFPIMSVRSAEADDDSMQEQITTWFAEKGVDEVPFSPAQWRALTLATAVVGELASHASGTLLPQQGQAPMLYLQPLLPQDWDLQSRGAAGQWLRHVALENGWPDQQLSVAAAVPVDARGASPAAVLGRVGHQITTSGMPLVSIVVACDSRLSEDCVDRWAGSATLFGAARPQGQIPGEGAAGMLLTDLAQAQATPDTLYTTVHTTPETRRHTSADEAKKTDATALSTLIAKLLADAQVDAATVGMLVADTDHRTSRVMELMATASSSLPHLDTGADVLSTGGACGHCGSVPLMAALALAHHHATELAAPVVCISNDDPYRRSAILIRPAAALS